MEIPEIFKYGSIVSVPLAGIIALLLVKTTPKYSLSKYTFSQAIMFSANETSTLIFRLNFVIKAILDICFSLYELHTFNISFVSPIAYSLFISSLLFGSLAYIVEGKQTILHRTLVFVSGILWLIAQIAITRYLHNDYFTNLTEFVLIIPMLIGFYSVIARKVNAFYQIGCIGVWYLWILYFVFYYL